MSESLRFRLLYSKVQEVLESDARTERERAGVEIRCAGEISREELDEFRRLREIILATSSPDPISFTTT